MAEFFERLPGTAADQSEPSNEEGQSPSQSSGSQPLSSRRRWLFGSAGLAAGAGCASSPEAVTQQPEIPPQPPSQDLLQYARGLERTQMVHVAAELGIADHLAGGGKTTEELAQLTRSHTPTLYRLLRALQSIGILDQRAPNRFSLTPVGELLRSGHPDGLRELVLWNGAQWRHRAWANLIHSVQTGQTAMNYTFGTGLFEYMKQHPEDAEVYRNYMTFTIGRIADALVEKYNFSAFGSVADLGGGEGLALAKILKSAPDMQGTLFDLPETVAPAREFLTEQNVMERCKVVGGNFFESVPPAEVYLLMRILRDWRNAEAVKILMNCRQAIQSNGRLLVVEKITPANPFDPRYPIADIHMLVETGGELRSQEQFRALLDQASFRLERVMPLEADLGEDYPLSILEAMPA